MYLRDFPLYQQSSPAPFQCVERLLHPFSLAFLPPLISTIPARPVTATEPRIPFRPVTAPEPRSLQDWLALQVLLVIRLLRPGVS